ncbi:MAG: peroxiredoxin family protein [Holosporales bacterium]|nr:peroxiredoxin family protein [Holosporales bacterium]
MCVFKYFISVILLSSTILADQQQYPVFQAQAGSMPPQQNWGNQSGQGSDGQSQLNSQGGGGTTDLNALAKAPVQKKEENNEFLQFYTRQGSEVIVTVFYQRDQKLVKKNISQDKLKKAVVVFFGDWCPHCDNFLKVFAKNVEPLRKYGVHITFVNIPAIDKLRKWKDPTLDEFNMAENKISSYGISLKDGVEVAVLGDIATLSRVDIEGLPVLVAVKKGKEQYRVVGENGAEKLNFGSTEVLMNFLAIWDDRSADKALEEPKDEEDTIIDETPKKEKADEGKKSKGSKSKKSKNKRGRKSSTKASLRDLARRRSLLTDMLNRL